MRGTAAFLVSAGALFAIFDLPYRFGAAPRLLAARVSDAAARGDAGALWELLTVDARLRIDERHRDRIRASWTAVKDSGITEPSEPYLLEAHRVSAQPSDRAWREWIEAALGSASRRDAYRDYRIDSIELDGPRAIVRGTLGDGTRQTLRMIRTEDGWRLEGFEPYS